MTSVPAIDRTKFTLTVTVDVDLTTRSTIQQLSDAAFRRPVWSDAGIEPSCILELLSLPDSTLFLVQTKSSCELAAFAIGLRLTTTSLEYTQLDQFAVLASNGPTPKPGDYHLTWRAVASRYLGQGIGVWLTQERLTFAASIGCNFVYGETLATNFGAIAMHRSLGFHIYHRTDHLGPAGLFQRVYFRKSL
jgi:ribosomal protein S18 acetylase RimI-like enzyme